MTNRLKRGVSGRIAAIAVLAGLAALSCARREDPTPRPDPALPSGEEILLRSQALSEFKDRTLKIRAQVQDEGGSVQEFVIVTHRLRNGGKIYSLSQVIKPELGNALLSIEDGTGASNVTYMPGFAKYFEVDSSREDPVFGLSIQESLSASGLYSYQTQGAGRIDGEEAYIIEGTLKPDADSNLKRTVDYISRKDFLLLKTEAYNARDEIMRNKRYLDYQQIGGYWTAIRTEIENVARKKRVTFLIQEAKYDQRLPISMFSREHLKRISKGVN